MPNLVRRGTRSTAANGYRRLYKSAFWLQKRSLHLASYPLCAMCEAEGRVTPATVADHIVPHKGNVTLFVTGELQSLCQSCHSTVKQSEERHGYSKRVDPLTGWPVDVRHPANKE